MKILFDHNVPKPLRRDLPGHEVVTTAKMGWQQLSNGKLLAAAAAAGFELFLTVDQNLWSQQNLNVLPIAVVVLVAHTNRIIDLQPLVPLLLRHLSAATTGQLVEIELPDRIERISLRSDF